MSETTGSPMEQKQQDLNSSEMAGQDRGLEESQPDKDAPKPKSSFEKYCDDNPSAAECLIYEE